MHESVDQEIQTLQSIFWSERDPDGLAFASLADAFRRKGAVRDALDLLTDGMSRHPDFVTGHAVVTRLYRDQGMDFEAELAARRVLELDPENVVGLSVLTGVLAERGEVGEAARHRTTLLSVDPESDEARAVVGLPLGGEPAGSSESESAAGATTEPPESAVWDVELDEAGADDHVSMASPGPAEITELVPETMYRAGSPDSLLDDLTLEEPGNETLDSGVAEEELSLAMDALGLVGEDELPSADEADKVLQAALPGPEIELEGLDALGSDDAEVVDLGALAPDEAPGVDEDVMDLDVLAPDVAAESDDLVMDLDALAPDVVAESDDLVMDLDALAPDVVAGSDDLVMDLDALAPDEPGASDDLVMDLDALAPDDTTEPDEVVMDLDALAPDVVAESDDLVMDLDALAPDEPGASDDLVMDLDALAPDEPTESGDLVMDLDALAPDEPVASDDLVMDLDALAPDETTEPDDLVMDLGALAPDEPAASDDLVMDLDALAPDEPTESGDLVMDLDALAPDEPGVVEMDALAPDEPVAGSDDKLTESAKAETPDMKDKPSEPIYTRTLADLYIKQGFDDKALEVLKALQARHPDDADLTDRIATLERGGTPEVSLPDVTPEGDGHTDDDVETRARELAEHGKETEDDVDTPFAWTASPDAREDGDSGDDPPAGSYFDQLLAWENRAES